MDALAAHLSRQPTVRAVYTDLDGTLLGRGGALLRDAEGRPGPGAAHALVAALRAGVIVVAVSGRRASTLRHDVRLLGLHGGIAEVGSVVVRDGVHHLRWGECPPDLGATPREALRNAGALDVLLAHLGGDLRPYEPWDEGREGGFLLHGRVDVEHADAVLAAAGIDWAKIVDNGRADGWEGREVHAYHLLARGVGKAEALAEDLAHRGLDAAEGMAIGDSREDQTMASAVGTYVIVGNGHGEEGDNRFRVAGHNGAGVAEAIHAALDVVR